MRETADTLKISPELARSASLISIIILFGISHHLCACNFEITDPVSFDELSSLFNDARGLLLFLGYFIANDVGKNTNSDFVIKVCKRGFLYGLTLGNILCEIHLNGRSIKEILD